MHILKLQKICCTEWYHAWMGGQRPSPAPWAPWWTTSRRCGRTSCCAPGARNLATITVCRVFKVVWKNWRTNIHKNISDLSLQDEISLALVPDLSWASSWWGPGWTWRRLTWWSTSRRPRPLPPRCRCSPPSLPAQRLPCPSPPCMVEVVKGTNILMEWKAQYIRNAKRLDEIRRTYLALSSNFMSMGSLAKSASVLPVAAFLFSRAKTSSMRRIIPSMSSASAFFWSMILAVLKKNQVFHTHSDDVWGARSYPIHTLFNAVIPHLLLVYHILHNVDGIDGFPELVLLPRVVVEPLSQLLNRLVQFPGGEGSNLEWNIEFVWSDRVVSITALLLHVPSVLLGAAILILVAAVVGLPDEVDALHWHLHAGLEVIELLIFVVHYCVR